nr:hypothetical protein [Tanacetum cinerariifolium]
MERGLLSPKGSGGGRGVKEKNGVAPSIKDGIAPFVTVESRNYTGTSYANLFTGESIRKSLNFRTLFTPAGNKIDVVIPMKSIRAISERFANTVYGFFLGKRVAYPVVVNYDPDVNLLKEDVVNVPIWVKFYGVTVTAFSEDGLSVISTKFGTLLMIDSYTSDMCIQSWGRLSYARALIEVRADVELKDTIVVVIPKLAREGFYTCNVRVEYE